MELTEKHLYFKTAKGKLEWEGEVTRKAWVSLAQGVGCVGGDAWRSGTVLQSVGTRPESRPHSPTKESICSNEVRLRGASIRGRPRVWKFSHCKDKGNPLHVFFPGRSKYWGAFLLSRRPQSWRRLRRGLTQHWLRVPPCLHGQTRALDGRCVISPDSLSHALSACGEFKKLFLEVRLL